MRLDAASSVTEAFDTAKANDIDADRGMMVKSADTTDFRLEPKDWETAFGMRSNSANSLARGA